MQYIYSMLSPSLVRGYCFFFRSNAANGESSIDRKTHLLNRIENELAETIDATRVMKNECASHLCVWTVYCCAMPMPMPYTAYRYGWSGEGRSTDILRLRRSIRHQQRRLTVSIAVVRYRRRIPSPSSSRHISFSLHLAMHETFRFFLWIDDTQWCNAQHWQRLIPCVVCAFAVDGIGARRRPAMPNTRRASRTMQQRPSNAFNNNKWIINHPIEWIEDWSKMNTRPEQQQQQHVFGLEWKVWFAGAILLPPVHNSINTQS